MSSVLRLEMRLEESEKEITRLKAELAQAQQGPAEAGTVAVVVASSDGALTLSELLRKAEQAVRKLKPKRSVAGYLKNVRPGEVLTQPQIVQAMKEQNAAEKAKVEQKAADKRDLQELRKREKAAAAAAKKRKRDDAPPPRRRRRALATAQEERKGDEVEEEEEKEEEKNEADSSCNVM
jgi:hypothetical protein